MSRYTAVLFAHNWFAHHGTYTLTREVSTCDKNSVIESLLKESKIEKKNIDTIVLLKNGKASPEVVVVWSFKPEPHHE